MVHPRFLSVCHISLYFYNLIIRVLCFWYLNEAILCDLYICLATYGHIMSCCSWSDFPTILFFFFYDLVDPLWLTGHSLTYVSLYNFVFILHSSCRSKYEKQEFLKPSLRISSGKNSESIQSSFSQKLMSSFRRKPSENQSVNLYALI